MNEMELKPCPFCGDEAYTKVEIVKTIETEMLFSVGCTRCGIHRCSYAERDCSFDDIISAMYLAIERWNRRTDNG